ncbi:ubiquinol-cytochrome c reductase iron-sulfur subunit [Rugosimonospora acidiphila]|uniref:Cytochrome bc1 complex Rieske iron-sulfur subunit n=1 Tax=Rugosimonospora acidiphila TaxID=556531 RepID=A0ABP9RRU3_9ACTN
MSTPTAHEDDFDADNPELTRFDLVREGARRDGVQIVHYAPKFPVPGTKREKRVERTIALMFVITALAALAFLISYIWWPYEYKSGFNINKYYTPILGVTLALTLASIGFAIITWSKKLLPDEISVQDRHDQVPNDTERKLTGATMMNMVDELGIKRRPLLRRAALLGLAPVGVLAAAPIVGGLIKDPHHPDILVHTGWDNKLTNNGKPIRLVRDDLTPIRPEDVSIGGQMTVFPGIPGGNTNDYGDSPTLLIHLRDSDADELRGNLSHVKVNANNMYGNLVAYSKICTHAGCPASLFEQQTNILLCPCHQSQFNILDNARPIFGPATRRLPMLPIGVDDEGFLIAKSDYQVPVGPGFWERP